MASAASRPHNDNVMTFPAMTRIPCHCEWSEAISWQKIHHGGSLYNLVASIGVVSLLSSLFLLSGYRLYQRALNNYPEPSSFRLGAGFFLGSAIFLVSWRLAAIFLGRADLSLYIALAIITLSALSPKTFSRILAEVNSLFKNRAHVAVFFLLAVSTATLLYEVSPWSGQVQHWFNLGSTHAPRYANISLQVFSENRIPVYGQDYEQSLLASVPLFFRVTSPLLCLYLWLVISMCALTSVIYGFFRTQSLAPETSIACTLLLMGGNASLSAIHVQVFDNGFPFFLCGKTDLIRSMGSFFIILACFQSFIAKRKIETLPCVFILALLSVSWVLSGVQNIFLSVVLIGSIIWLQRSEGTKSAVSKLALILAIVVPCILVSQYGGMLTAVKRRDVKAVPGVINFVPIPSVHMFQIDPTVPFAAQGKFWDEHLPKPIPFTVSSLLRVRSVSFFLDILFSIELNLWMGVKTLFFPLAGLVWMGILIWKRNETYAKYFPVWLAAVIVFCAGFPINTFFDLSWYRWGLSRFMIPGYTLGSACLLICAVETFSLELKESTRRLAWGLLALLLLVGPCGSFLIHAASNLRHMGPFTQSVAFMAQSATYIP
jgi:hypothetical protein